MELLLLVLVAVLPAFFLLYFIFQKDSYKPEPRVQLLKAFGWGIVAALISILIEIPLQSILSLFYIPYISELLDAFCVAAIPEELSKLLCLWLFFKSCKYFDEYVDGIVYSVCVGLGFAAFENIGYLLSVDNWFSLGIVRALLSVPGHYAFAVLMGYYYSLIHFRGFANKKYKSLVLIAPVVAHGIFDALLMMSSISAGAGVLLVIVFLIFNNILHKNCSAKISELLNRDRENLV